MPFQRLTTLTNHFGHGRYRALLSPYLDGELPAEQKARIEAHLATCQTCQTEYEELQFAARLAAQLFVPDDAATAFPRWRREQVPAPNRNRKLALAMATVAFVCLALVATWYFRREKSDTWAVLRLAGSPTIVAHSMGSQGQIKSGEWLETDAVSRALIKVGLIGQVEVSPNTRIGLVTAHANEHRMSLTKGRIAATINAPPQLFFIETPAGTAIDYGCAYTLEVNDAGESLLHVTSGWVGLNLGGRESLVPAGAICRSVPGKGPGTPYLEDASAAFRAALQQIDFAGSDSAALNTVLAEARTKDALSLWHLLSRFDKQERERLYDRLAALVPPPSTITRDAALRLNRHALDAWKESIELASLGVTLPPTLESTGLVRPTSDLLEARFAHTATLLADGRVLLTGGIGPNFAPFTSTEFYNPASGRFIAGPPLLQTRAWHTATQLNNGQILFTGGVHSVSARHVLATAELYDPAKQTFTAVGQMKVARESHKATLLADGKVLISGGDNVTGNLDSAELYDPATRQFTPVGSLLTPRSDHVATLLNNGQVLMTGGITNGPSETQTVAKAELYDPLKRAFAPTGGLLTARAKHSAALLPDGKVIVIGGTDARLSLGKRASAELYDPAKGVFTQTGNMNTGRYKIRDAVVVLPSGKVLVAGGGSQVELYDPASGIFRLVKGDVGAARHYATATLLANGRVLFAGGYARGSALGLVPEAGAWIYQP
jgi:hypothetical protein